MKIIRLDEVDSTNEYIKRTSLKEDTIVIANRQTSGKGTKGRSFISTDGGVYLSYLRLGENDPFSVLIDACVAVCKTLEKFALSPVIRWANDVLCEGLKISGTLIENKFSGNKMKYSIVGIGLNVNNEIPKELDGIATSMKAILGKEIIMDEVEAELLKNLQKHFTVSDYKSYINYFGQKVIIDSEREVVALDIDERGRLIVEDDGVKILNTAEVSLRL